MTYYYLKKEGVIANRRTGSNLFGGAVTKPRLDKYLNDLIKCKKKIDIYANIINEFIDLSLDLVKKIGSNEHVDPIEYNAFLELYLKFTRIIDIARGNYIKVIPMIFFITEFPPDIYISKNPPSYYVFTNNESTVSGELYVKNSTGNYEKQSEKIGPYEEVHAAFLKSTNKNTTNFMLNDDILGLGKILENTSDGDSPRNHVMNMMFALGASGTGKTTRYFGADRNDKKSSPDDYEGISSFLANSAKNIGATKIHVAYFVCYGQENTNTTESRKIKEILLFVNPKSVNLESKKNPLLSKRNDGFDDNKTFIPYVDEDNIVPKNKGFRSFYTDLINKKLSPTKYDRIKEFILGQKQEIEPNNKSNAVTFRNIIEQNPDIWKDITDVGSDDQIKIMFDLLLSEQKKIYTVLPTMNNIESSRCHTCVLFRFTFIDKNGVEQYKYFPLFDMAGTENTEKIEEFFGRYKSVGMVKLLDYINNSDKIEISDNTETTIPPSLRTLLEYDNDDQFKDAKIKLNYYLKAAQQKGGAVNSNVLLDRTNDKSIYKRPPLDSALDCDKFIAKIPLEGKYINHTIATLVLATLCVGKAINSTVDTKDHFDDIGVDVVDALSNVASATTDKKKTQTKSNNKICFVGEPSELPNPSDASKPIINCTDTRLLYDLPNSDDKKNDLFNKILLDSSIWAQVLFSFLYWNSESDESKQKLADIMLSDETPIGPWTTTLKEEYSQFVDDINDEDSNYEFIKGYTLNKITDFDENTMNNVNSYMQYVSNNNAQISKDNSNNFKITKNNIVYNFNTDGTIGSTERKKKYEKIAEQFKPIDIDKMYTTYNNKSIHDKLPEKDSTKAKVIVNQIIEILKNIDFRKMYNAIFNIDTIGDKKDSSENKKPNDTKKPTIETGRKGPSVSELKRQKDNAEASLLKKGIDNMVRNKSIEYDENLFSLYKNLKYLFVALTFDTGFAFGNNSNYEKYLFADIPGTDSYASNSSGREYVQYYLAESKNLLSGLSLDTDINGSKLKELFMNSTDEDVRNAIITHIQKTVKSNIKNIEQLVTFETEHNKKISQSVIDFIKSADGNSTKITNLATKIKKFQENYVKPDDRTDATPSDPDTAQITAQINRIKAGRCAATKMTLMHLITGEEPKKDMVKNTLTLCQTLFSATKLDTKPETK